MDLNHPTALFTDHKPIIFHLHKNQTQTFQLILMKPQNLYTVWTAKKNLALPDTLSTNTPPELLTRKITVEIPQNKKLCKR